MVGQCLAGRVLPMQSTDPLPMLDALPSYLSAPQQTPQALTAAPCSVPSKAGVYPPQSMPQVSAALILPN